jgi:hypothetical protein
MLMPRKKNTRKAIQEKKAREAAKLTPRQKRLAQRLQPRPSSMTGIEMAVIASGILGSDRSR